MDYCRIRTCRHVLLDLAYVFDVPLKDLLWVDKEFRSGLFYKYTDVPGNTKVKYFLDWATGNKIMKQLSEHSSDPLVELRKIHPEDTCGLNIFFKIMMNYQDQLLQMVDYMKGTITELHYQKEANTWKAKLNSTESHDSSIPEEKALEHSIVIESTNVCLAVGGKPVRHTNLHLGLPGKKPLPLEKCFSLDYLKANVPEGKTVAIVGNSHSAWVVMHHLHQLNIKDLKVVSFYRGDIRYAQFYPDFILYDNTGLKGIVCDWAKTIMDGTQTPSFAYKRVSVADEDQMTTHIQTCDLFVYAIGYQRYDLPSIYYTPADMPKYEYFESKTPNVSRYVSHSNVNGCLQIPSKANNHESLAGLYGFGLAFSEKVITPAGEVEENIGHFKFWKCAERWLQHTKY